MKRNFLTRICSFLDFYKILEEEHQLYYIEKWDKVDDGEVIITVKSLSSGIVYKSPVRNLFMNKAIFHNLQGSDKEKIELFMEACGQYSIDSVEFQQEEKIYRVNDLSGNKFVFSERDALGHIDDFDKKSIKIILRESANSQNFHEWKAQC